MMMSWSREENPCLIPLALVSVTHKKNASSCFCNFAIGFAWVSVNVFWSTLTTGTAFIDNSRLLGIVKPSGNSSCNHTIFGVKQFNTLSSNSCLKLLGKGRGLNTSRSLSLSVMYIKVAFSILSNRSFQASTQEKNCPEDCWASNGSAISTFSISLIVANSKST